MSGPALRIPTADDPFLRTHAGRMFKLLTAVNAHPLDRPLSGETVNAIWRFFGEALADGIDTIAVAEQGLHPTPAEAFDRAPFGE